MMSTPPKTTGEHELIIFLQTNEPVPVRPLLNLIYEVERIALTQRHLGPLGLVELTEVTTGTKLVRLTFDRKVALGGLAATVFGLGSDLSERIQKPAGRLAETVAEMCLDHGVAECVIVSAEGQVRINRDQLPAIAVVQQKRDGRTALGQNQSPVEGDLNAPRLDPRSVRMEETQLVAPRRDGKIYTIVGKLQPPGTAGNVVSEQDWQFDTPSGKTYAARGINADRVRNSKNGAVVIRAENIGNADGLTILAVKDVFDSEEP